MFNNGASECFACEGGSKIFRKKILTAQAFAEPPLDGKWQAGHLSNPLAPTIFKKLTNIYYYRLIQL